RDAAAPTVRFDGQTVALSADAGNAVRVGTLEGLASSGEHVLSVRGGLALVALEARLAMPWEPAGGRSESAGRVEVSFEGPLGARDRRAGLRLVLRNGDPQVLRTPVVLVDLPAGVELDEATREELAAAGAEEAELDGRTLRLWLPALGPGAVRALPLRLRWAVGGVLRGLGVQVFDAGQTSALAPGGGARSVLPPRDLEIADEGPPVQVPDTPPEGARGGEGEAPPRWPEPLVPVASAPRFEVAEVVFA
ncbi:MAG: hypothetical protein AAF447_27595, partial [Myxococcota bacterium]